MVSIIIVSFNRKDLVEKCLLSALNNSPEGNEIIVVDNASADGTPELIAKEFPVVKLIRNKTNVGFAQGNNLGMNKAVGDYFFLLNTDAFLEKGNLPRLQKFLEDHPDAGAVAPQLRNVDGSVQPSGGFFPHLWQIFLIMTFIDNLPVFKKFLPSIHVRDRNFFTKVQAVGWAAGAALMVPKKVFLETKGLDKDIFMYGEELEWCYRINQAGYKIYLDPETHLTHVGFASSSSRSYGIVKEMESFVFFYKKHKPGWQLPILVSLVTLGCLLRVLRGILTFKPAMIKTYSLALKKVYSDL